MMLLKEPGKVESIPCNECNPSKTASVLHSFLVSNKPTDPTLANNHANAQQMAERILAG